MEDPRKFLFLPLLGAFDTLLLLACAIRYPDTRVVAGLAACGFAFMTWFCFSHWSHLRRYRR